MTAYVNPKKGVTRFIFTGLFSIFLVFLLTACSGTSQRTGTNTSNSSLTNFLYPKAQTKVTQAKQLPHLKLPVRVGLAFLPSEHWHNATLDTNVEYRLLNKVKQRFSQHAFIEEMTIIPSTYFRINKVKKQTGFDTLTQVSRLHNVDVIALVSYDQLSKSQQNSASLLYWTIVGMYVIPGNENTISTFVDTAVFDVKSRQLLLRAPGLSKITKNSTVVDVDRVMSKKSITGFNLAFDDMVKNLDTELTRFRAKIKNGEGALVTQ